MYHVLASLAVWRITSLLVDEEGPFDIFEKLRWAVGLNKRERVEDNFIQKALSCFWCSSLYVAIPFALFTDHFVISWLGYSGAAIIIHSIIEKLDV